MLLGWQRALGLNRNRTLFSKPLRLNQSTRAKPTQSYSTCRSSSTLSIRAFNQETFLEKPASSFSELGLVHIPKTQVRQLQAHKQRSRQSEQARNYQIRRIISLQISTVTHFSSNKAPNCIECNNSPAGNHTGAHIY